MSCTRRSPSAGATAHYAPSRSDTDWEHLSKIRSGRDHCPVGRQQIVRMREIWARRSLDQCLRARILLPEVPQELDVLLVTLIPDG